MIPLGFSIGRELFLGVSLFSGTFCQFHRFVGPIEKDVSVAPDLEVVKADNRTVNDDRTNEQNRGQPNIQGTHELTSYRW